MLVSNWIVNNSSNLPIFCGILFYPNITPVLRSLHWLPGESRIAFAFFHCIHGSAPRYFFCKNIYSYTISLIFLYLSVSRPVHVPKSRKSCCNSHFRILDPHSGITYMYIFKSPIFLELILSRLVWKPPYLMWLKLFCLIFLYCVRIPSCVP